MTAYYQLIQRDIDAQGRVTAHYRSTDLAQGAWNAHEQHMAPAAGIICEELNQFSPREGMRIGRISLDILGLIPAGEFQIITQVIRPGKTIELIESEMRVQGKSCISVRTWRMMTQNSAEISGVEDHQVLGPENAPIWEGIYQWPGKFIQSIEARSHERRAGKGIVWLTTAYDMVEGKATADFVRLMGLVDTANGVVSRQGFPMKWGFPNLDLQIHLHRAPAGKWLGLETVQQYGTDGIGLSSAILHDLQGPFGRSEQILTLRPLAK